MLLEKMIEGLGIERHEAAGEIKALFSALPESELETIVAETESLNDDSKEVIVAALEFIIEQDEFEDDEVADIIFAAFAAAPLAVSHGYFSDDTTDAVEYMMDCIIEGERNVGVLRTHAHDVLGNY